MKKFFVVFFVMVAAVSFAAEIVIPPDPVATTDGKSTTVFFSDAYLKAVGCAGETMRISSDLTGPNPEIGKLPRLKKADKGFSITAPGVLPTVSVTVFCGQNNGHEIWSSEQFRMLIIDSGKEFGNRRFVSTPNDGWKGWNQVLTVNK
jgi:hypothetical protein